MNNAEQAGGIEFGPFHLLPQRREAYRAGVPLNLKGRSFDLLLALVEAAGRVLSKDELLKTVWPGRVVLEGSLHVQVTDLRKALAPDGRLIKTVPGRGYQFVGEIRRHAPEAPAAVQSRTVSRLPAPLAPIVGRETELRQLTAQLERHRQLTLAGPGGIGKTRLALELARQVAPAFKNGVTLVELGSLGDPALLPTTIAAALGATPGRHETSFDRDIARVIEAIGERALLIVLDNCEHLIDMAAHATEAMLKACASLHILVTSREPLRIDGEFVHRVPPLHVPQATLEDTAAVLDTEAMRLFAARAQAALPGLQSDARAVRLAAGICRYLDGIPLAIELACGRLGALGIEQLASHLAQRFDVLAGGNRTSQPRHRTIRATLDWSHDMLCAREQTTFRRLGVFAGTFDLDGACAIACDEHISPADVLDDLGALAEKSLIVVDSTGATALYRLLEIQKSYAREHLVLSGELAQTKSRLACLCCEWFTQDSPFIIRSPELYAGRLDDVRGALDWCYGDAGEFRLGARLAHLSGPLWYALSQVSEYRGRLIRALEHHLADENADQETELALSVALGVAETNTVGYLFGENRRFGMPARMPERASPSLQDSQLYWGNWLVALAAGDYQETIRIAHRLEADNASTPNAGSDIPIRMAACAYFFAGNFDQAREYGRRYAASAGSSPPSHYPFEFLQPLAFACESVWIQGNPERGRALAYQLTQEYSSRNATAYSHALLICCIVELWAGHDEQAERLADQLRTLAEKHALDFWALWATLCKAVLRYRRGECSGQEVIDTIDRPQRTTTHIDYLSTFGLPASELCQAFWSPGDREVPDSWCTAEILRLQMEARVAQDGGRWSPQAEALLARALRLARQQGALSWELRTAISNFQLRRQSEHGPQARALLANVTEKFTEGRDTADLRLALSLLES
jgi:predicted ATPase/DNA-binding winged helix-turn-helix (wHTH) protein